VLEGVGGFNLAAASLSYRMYFHAQIFFPQPEL
jgi:hypothetical protein